MTSRGKNAVRGFETEIERSREEANWKKAVELAQQLKARSPQHESLAHFLIGEGKLEAYLEEWPPSREHAERAQRELSEARGYLTLATDEAGRQAGVALDAHLLLGKLHYACGACADALRHYQLAELGALAEKELPVRSLRVVAEAFAIRGLCLELGAPPASRYKQAECDNEMVRSFEVSSELTLLYLQRCCARAGPVLETALQRAPLLHVRAARLPRAVERYRAMLRAVEAPSTQALRLTLARQLAEVLLRGAPGQVYQAPAGEAAGGAGGSLARRRADTDSPWKPRQYASINQFVPRNEYEEVVLVLLVGEAMAARDAVLSQSGEFAAARDHALRNAVAVLDLLALCAARWGQLCLLLESLERAMKFSFGCAHVWRQRALATAAQAPHAPPAHAAHSAHAAHAAHAAHGDPLAPSAAGWSAAQRAAGVMRRALVLAPRDAALRLVAAQGAYRTGWIEEGIELSEAALRIEEERQGSEGERRSESESEGEEGAEGAGEGTHLLARCCLYAGIGYQMKAQKSNCRLEKEAANSTCLTLLLRAARLDGNDHLALYHLALQYMHLGMLNEAMDATRSCLQARAECGGGLRLAAALWSCACAGPRGARALQAARLARHHYPAAEWPLWALAALQLRWESGEAALATGKELLSLLNGAEAEAEAEAAAGEHNGYAELDALSDSQADDTHSTRDAASLRAESAGAWRLERALSEGASSASAAGAGAGAGGAARARSPLAAHRAHAWLTLADLCLRLGRVSAAAGCVSEAAALTPFSHLVFYTRGLVHLAGAEWAAARACLQSALAIHPTHLDAMLHLGAAYYQLGWLRLAEKTLREACALAPRRAEPWRRLALVLAALGEPAAAADANIAALALQPQLPALPLPL